MDQSLAATTMTRPTLIHIHIPKTAGSTLNYLLSEAFGEHRQFICALQEHVEQLAAEPQDERDRTDFIFGHYQYGLHRLFTRPVLYMACLREPRQRILSFYRFVLAQEDHPLRDTVQRNSRNFSSFLRLACEDAAVRDAVDNVQVRMLAGDMELRAGYDDILPLALANITAGNFLVGDMRDVDALLTRLSRALHLTFGPVPRLNASEEGVSFGEEMQRLAPDAHKILERFVMSDTILCAVARDTAGNPLRALSAPPQAPAAGEGLAAQSLLTRPTMSQQPPAVTAQAGDGEPAVSGFVRALYRALLFREPDPIGLNAYVKDIDDGLPIENAIRRMLRSKEFAGKRAEFARSYLPAPASPTIEFEQVTHECEGRKVTFALNKAARDSYTEALRRALPAEHFIPYVLRRAKQTGRSLRIADFGANVGVVSLPLAANGMRVLAIEALPANFLALATAARANGWHDFLPVNMAALDRAGLVSFSGHSAWATAGIGGGDVTVSCDTLVNILQTYGFADADIIKIDIEGAELPALRGADAFFAERPDAEVIFESNNHTCQLFSYDRQDLLRWFEDRGFSTYMFRPDGLMPIGHDDPQPVPVVDILATRRSAGSLAQQGETIVAMTDDYVLQELLRVSTSTNPTIRRHFVTEAGRVRGSAKTSPLWPRIVGAM